MEIKKTPKADLENKKGLFTEIGLAIVLGLCLAAFEYSTREVSIDLSAMPDEEVVEEEIVPVTKQEEIKPPPPPPPPKMADVLNLVDDNTELDDDAEIFDSEFEEDAAVEFVEVDVEEEAVEETEEVFFIVEQMPIFPGGDEALRKYLATSVKYPVIAQENGIQGRVLLQFVVEKDGTLGQIKVLQTPDQSLADGAIRVLMKSPKWKPAKQRNKPVRLSFTMPVEFRLQN
jgi:protein TonB